MTFLSRSPLKLTFSPHAHTQTRVHTHSHSDGAAATHSSAPVKRKIIKSPNDGDKKRVKNPFIINELVLTQEEREFFINEEGDELKKVGRVSFSFSCVLCRGFFDVSI